MQDSDPAEEVFAQIGITLLLVQDFEHLLSFALRIALKKHTDISVNNITKREIRTLGRMMKDLKEATHLDSDIEDLLRRVLENRNLFVHKLRQQSWFDPHSPEGRREVWKFFMKFCPDLEEAIMLFTALAFSFAKQIKFSHPSEKELLKELRVSGFLDRLESTYIPKINSKIKPRS